MTDTQARIEAEMSSIMKLMAHAWAGDPELLAAHSGVCPQHMYAEFQRNGPVRDFGDGYFSLHTMEDILYVTRHPAVEQGSKHLGSDRPAIPLGLDGEIHKQYRRLIDPIFTPGKVAPLADNVRQLAGELIDGFIDERRADVFANWCEPLPSTIFLSIMGLPMEDRNDFIRFKNLTLAGSSDPNLTEEERVANRMAAVQWIHGYFNASLDEREREAEPRDDIIGKLLTAEVDGHGLTRQDVLDILGLFMIAGLDTVASSLACFLSYFARHPEDRRRIVDDRTLLRPAIEELMRYESPVTEGYRIATEDLRLPSGTTIPAGSWMHVSWSAANLDASVFDDPLTPDITRNPNPHIGFASGYHRCLGSHLARMEMFNSLDVWHDRIPDYEIASGSSLEYTGNPRAPHALTLVW